MNQANFLILYVDNLNTSLEFYKRLLNVVPTECSAHFCLFSEVMGITLGLWQRGEVEPLVHAKAGACELVITGESKAGVNTLHDKWVKEGVRIIQQPVTMEFGYTFVAQDCDGHRIRVYAGA